MQKNINLDPQLDAERPRFLAREYVALGRGVAVLVSWPNGAGEVVVTAQYLIPLGVYTAWYVTDKGAYPLAPLKAEYTSDGWDPNRLVVNKNGTLNYYIAHLDFDPLAGIPTPNGLARPLRIVLAFHPDGTTHGLEPGPHFSHLVGNVV